MKFKCSFDYRIADDARRHPDILFSVPLEFPFPKNVEVALQEMKRDRPDDYKKLKGEQFLAYTGIEPGVFEKDFVSRMKPIIQSNYESQIKKNAKPNFTPDEWTKLLNFFKDKQSALVKYTFEKELADKTKVAYDKLQKLRDSLGKVKPADVVLGVEESFVLWLSKHPLKFSLEDKFKRDHIANKTSHKDIIDISIARYKKNKTMTSSWVALSEGSLVGKAGSGAAYPSVFKGAQQVAVKIKAEAADVSIVDDFKTTGQKQRADAARNKFNHEIETDRWVTVKFDSVDEFYIYGKWNPKTGEAEIFHFDTKKPAIGLQDPYRKWTHDAKTGSYIEK